MDIRIGKLVENRTLSYLFPALQIYGSTFLAKFNLVYKLGYGIHDCILDGTPFADQKKICMLVDRKVRPNLYNDFCRWIRLQDYYITDYAFDNCETGRLQMFVIEFPQEHIAIYDNFVFSKYSKMYSQQEIDKYFKEDSRAKQVIRKDYKLSDIFVHLVNEKFGTTITSADLAQDDSEYDFPWNKEEEFFNYKETKEEVI